MQKAEINDLENRYLTCYLENLYEPVRFTKSSKRRSSPPLISLEGNTNKTKNYKKLQFPASIFIFQSPPSPPQKKPR